MSWQITRAWWVAGLILVIAACVIPEEKITPSDRTAESTITSPVSTALKSTEISKTSDDIEPETPALETTSSESSNAAESTTAPPENQDPKSSSPEATAAVQRTSPTSTPTYLPDSSTPVDSAANPGTSDSVVSSMFGPITCRDGEDDVKLTHLFYDVDRFEILVPMGRMWDSHVTPTDHLYAFSEEHHVPGMVKTPAAGRLISVASFPREQYPFWDPTDTSPDLRLVIAHSCTLFSVFIHAGPLAPEIADVIGEIEMGRGWYPGPDDAIELEAGDPVAFFAGSNLDYSLHDDTQLLTGFQIPEHYEGESWKVHTVDPFDYMTDDIFAALLAKNVRQVEPYGGKIDYDVVGTLAGNWFMDGTIGYAGNGTDRDRYWNGHMSISYDHVDPEQIRISVGRDLGISEDYRACGGVYAVMNNSPDPATVTAADGIVVYEFTGRERITQDDAERSVSNGVLLGSFIVQVIDDETIQVEFVRGIDANSVQGFSDESVLYRR